MRRQPVIRILAAATALALVCAGRVSAAQFSLGGATFDAKFEEDFNPINGTQWTQTEGNVSAGIFTLNSGKYDLTSVNPFADFSAAAEWAYYLRFLIPTNANYSTTGGQRLFSVLNSQDIYLGAHGSGNSLALMATTFYYENQPDTWHSGYVYNEGQFYNLGVHKKTNGLYDIYVDNLTTPVATDVTSANYDGVEVPLFYNFQWQSSQGGAQSQLDFVMAGTLIPEPSSLLLAAIGLLGLLGWGKRFRI